MRHCAILLPLLLLAAGLPVRDPVTIYLAGDSTMAPKQDDQRPKTGWGEAFQDLFDVAEVRVSNHAVNGASTRSFLSDGRWQAMVDSLRPGDYVLIQFGHNDQPKAEGNPYTPPHEYRRNLTRFVADVRERQATPVLLTSVVRRRFDQDDGFYDTHGEVPGIVRSVAADEDILFIDMHRSSEALLTRLGAEESKSLFLHLAPDEHPNYPQGVEDDTHFSPGGAAEMARLAHQAFMSLTPGRFQAIMPHEPDYDFVVAQDGSGDFTTVQEAIDAVRDYTPIPRTIFIKSGVYREKLLIPSWKTDITLIGEDVETTIIDYDDYAGKGDINTFTSYTARISGDDIGVHDITFRNSAGPVGQALALFVEGDRVVFDNCRFEGNQDTIFAAGEGSRQYFRNSYVEGTTDFIFGPATAYFENCHIHSKRDSYITAASTPRNVPHGFVFVGCKLTAEPDVESVYLGRPWRDYARTIFISSELGAHVRPEGWHDWSRPEARHTSFYGEYGSTGPGAASEGRVSWARVLGAAEAERFTKEEVLCARGCGRVPWFERY